MRTLMRTMFGSLASPAPSRVTVSTLPELSGSGLRDRDRLRDRDQLRANRMCRVKHSKWRAQCGRGETAPSGQSRTCCGRWRLSANGTC